jgi:metal-responsive CopG/Arc/MetJ family transcriptional regulator
MVQIQREKTAVLSVSLPKQFRKDVVKYASKKDISTSQLVKEALRGYMFNQGWDELREVFKPLAKKLKIKSDEDVERIFK